ncbi:DNA polymerase III subunit gamma and tau [Nesterenkonia sp. MY13]|uniref:DNA polymerase III subunit gamma/tau n=1 Tax=Nesterenkonia sedimenti TaxID=1463632 RepID=A0A7X8TI80_9MICC|nr:DNA polymerase III subunit gamma and tau [Nesterenkonia sedimenti]NLS09228.1 DNA polymerase III subunit gamma and tau [Nesterenkonia sedimenti]
MSTALYRRYRPDTFADVIGQEHVTTPLMTALSKDAVSHAYLFSGPRGCGKTTSARILARCLNCSAGPTGTPCGECESCRDLATGGPGSLDVIEIDAASHGGVDDARDLRERATFAPVRDRYKIFIIDEAHMVTAAGFNALLKIVEEPPAHIKFIFATTEPDKVIGTIRSRTHHYPFRLVPPEPLLDYLERLCTQEGVATAPGVLQLVLRAGGGSVRDTLSVLDQLIAGAGTEGLDYDRAVALLGFTHATLLDEVVDAVSALDGAKAFHVVDRVVQSGQDPRRFVEDLLERLRDLIIVKSTPENPQAILRGVPEDQIRTMQNQTQQIGSAELSRAADITANALTEMVGATSPRLHLELLMARLLLPHAEQGQASLAARLERLERRMDFTAGAGSTPADEAPSEVTSQPPAPKPAVQPAPESQPTPEPDPEPGWAAPGVSGPPAAKPEPEPEPTPEPDRAPQQPQQPQQPHTQQPQPPQPAPAKPAPSQSPPGGGNTARMQQAWPDIVEAMKTRSRMLWMLVKGNVQVSGFDGQSLSLAFTNEGARNTFTNRGGEQALTEAIQEVVGIQVRLDLTGQGPPPKAEGRAEPSAPAEPQQPQPEPPQEWGSWDSEPEPAPEEPTPDSPSEPVRKKPPEKPVVPAFARRGPAQPPAAPSSPSSPSPAEAARAAMPSWDTPEEPNEDYDATPPPDWAEQPPPADEMEDIPSDDDADLEHSGVFGRRAIEKILDGVLIEERRLDDSGP